MIFWFFIIALTVVAVLSVLLPLARRYQSESSGDDHDREVYLDQLAELERERTEGRIAADEAEAARAEIARRLIGAETGGHAPETVGETEGDERFRRRLAALVALAAVPLATLATYNIIGSPHLPPQPLSARVQAPEAGQDIRILVARAERHLADNPDDGQGWEVLAPIYMRMERPGEAVRAFRNAVRLLGATAERQAGLGEAILAAEGGIVTQEARQAFERAVELDSTSVKGRFYLAVAHEQDGDREAAADGFRSVLADAPADAPWRPFIEQALARVAGDTAPGPTREQVEAAGDMSAEDRQAMIEGMVAGLAERLEREPADPEGWVRLVRAYLVLERRDDAVRTADKALKKIENPEQRKAIESMFESMGLKAGDIETR